MKLLGLLIPFILCLMFIAPANALYYGEYNSKYAINITAQPRDVLWLNLTQNGIICANANCTDVTVKDYLGNTIPYQVPLQNISTMKPSEFLVIPVTANGTSTFYIYWNSTNSSRLTEGVDFVTWEDDFESYANNTYPKASNNTYWNLKRYYVTTWNGKNWVGNLTENTLDIMPIGRTLSNLTLVVERNMTNKGGIEFTNITTGGDNPARGGYRMQVSTGTNIGIWKNVNSAWLVATAITGGTEGLIGQNWTFGYNGTSFLLNAHSSQGEKVYYGTGDTEKTFNYIYFTIGNLDAGARMMDRIIIYDNTKVSSSFTAESRKQIPTFQLFVEDTTPPVIIIDEPSGIYATSTVPVSYSAFNGEAGVNTSSCKYEFDGASNVSLPLCANTTVAVGQGNHIIKIFATNNVNLTGFNSSSFFVDSVAPDVSINLPANATYQSDNRTLAFDASDANLVLCRYELNGLPNVTIPSCQNTTFIASQGASVIKVIAVDIAGNEGWQYSYFTVDSIAPVVSIQSPSGDYLFASESLINITLRYTVFEDGTGIASCKYSIDSGSNVTVASCLNITFMTTLGSHSLAVYATDNAGLIGSASSSFRAGISARMTGTVSGVVNIYPIFLAIGMLLFGIGMMYMGYKSGKIETIYLGITILIIAVILLGITGSLVTEQVEPRFS